MLLSCSYGGLRGLRPCVPLWDTGRGGAPWVVKVRGCVALDGARAQGSFQLMEGGATRPLRTGAGWLAERGATRRRYAGWPCGATRISLRGRVRRFWLGLNCGGLRAGRGVLRVQGDGGTFYPGDDVGGQALALLLGEGTPTISGAFGDLQFNAIIGFSTVFAGCFHLRLSSHSITSLDTAYHGGRVFVNSANCTNYGLILL